MSGGAQQEGPAYGRAFALWRAQAAPHWGAYTRHSFVESLADGTLPREAFLHYLKQDYVFLHHFARAWALGIVKAGDAEEMAACGATVTALLEEELKLHVEICEGAGITRAALDATQEAPENMAYTRYVLEAGYSGDFLDLLAALAPCVLGYGEIGARLEADKTSDAYAEWIGTYGGAEYQALCRDVGGLIDSALEKRLGAGFAKLPRWSALCDRFTAATRLEVGFWDMGLRPEAD
jgi:thiaminase/transcriptional activator TenA